MLPLLSALPVIELAFDPIVQVGDLGVRLETLAVAGAIFLTLVLAAVIGRRVPVDLRFPPDTDGDEPGERNHLRADDLLYIAVSAIPGAVIGGRLGYALLHLDYFGSHPGALLDINQGGFELALGVVGGFLTGAMVASLLGAPLGRWMHAAALPVLFLLAAGKLAMVLGGSGQGVLFDGDWATAYVSPGPWGSLAPQLPAHPSQVYEALATIVVLLAVMVAMALGAFGRMAGGSFLLAVGLWAAARAAVATTWRDPVVLGPLRMGQVISIAIAVVFLVLLVTVSARGFVQGRRESTRVAEGGDDPAADGPSWPDPSTRPTI